MANLWNNPGIPHKGWFLAGSIEDGGSPIHRCEMCNKPDIRYLHPVTHPDYGNLTVGSECAEKLTEDAKVNYERKNLEKTNNRLKHYINHGWEQHSNNLWLRTYHNYNAAVMYINGYYRYAIFDNIRPWHFKTINEAKQASFEFITKRLS